MTLGILCPGQGGQGPEMLDLLVGNPAADAVLGAASSIMGVDLRALVRSPPETLHPNAIAQPLICAAELATFAALKPDLPPVRAFAGYSVGELAAHGCAGALEADELIRLAVRRAAAMDGACPEPQGLLAVRGLTRPEVEAVCADFGVFPAIVNDHDRVVVGGTRAALTGFEAAMTERGAGVTSLPVLVASHTPLMAAAAAAFAEILEPSGLRAPMTPVLAGIDGAPVHTRAGAVAALSTQIARTIDWAACIDGMVEMGCDVLLELGPGAALARMVRDRHPSVAVRSVAEFRTLTGVATWLERQG